MSFEAFRTGAVIRYPYLWSREADRGETEGRKFRPVAVAVRIPEPKGDDILLLLPITTQQPTAGTQAVEIPDTEKRRAGLDGALRLWIVLDDYNTDVVGASWFLEPVPPLGHFSRAFFLPLAKQFIAIRARAKGVDRRD